MRRGVGSGICLVALMAVYLLCPFRLGIVCGQSMEPTYHSGQAILIDRAYYRHHPIERGDVILLHVHGETLIKRVFARGGDSFHVCLVPGEDGISRFVVDNDMVGRIQRLCRLLPGHRLTRVSMLPGYVYVLGDNASVSIDSREFGPVPTDQIIGRVTGNSAPRNPANGPLPQIAVAEEAGAVSMTRRAGL